jgi:uncharacterized phosphatase
LDEIYFVRHGVAEANRNREFAGVSDTPLTQEGRNQSVEVGRQARDLNIDLIVSSPLSRARETAQIVANQICYPLESIVVAEILEERSFGVLEGQPWQAGIDLEDVSGAEKEEEMIRRARKAELWLRSLDSRRILVVGHGAFGLVLRTRFVSGATFSNRSIGSRESGLPNGVIMKWWPPGGEVD